MSKKCVLKEVVLLFPHLFVEEKTRTGFEGKYTTTIGIAGSNASDLMELKDAIEEEINKIAESHPEIPRSEIRNPLMDSSEMNLEEMLGEDWKTMRTATRQRPDIIDADGDVVLNPALVKHGAVASVSVVVRGYFFDGKAGVGCVLNNVMLSGDYKNLAYRRSAQEDFKELLRARKAQREGERTSFLD